MKCACNLHFVSEVLFVVAYVVFCQLSHEKTCDVLLLVHLNTVDFE